MSHVSASHEGFAFIPTGEHSIWGVVSNLWNVGMESIHLTWKVTLQDYQPNWSLHTKGNSHGNGELTGLADQTTEEGDCHMVRRNAILHYTRWPSSASKK
jgi:hypothetical protein